MTKPRRTTRAKICENSSAIILAQTSISIKPSQQQRSPLSLGCDVSKPISPNLIQLNLVGQEQPLIPVNLNCGETKAIRTPGVGPHFAGLRCANCDRFIKWIGKPGREA